MVSEEISRASERGESVLNTGPPKGTKKLKEIIEVGRESLTRTPGKRHA